VWQYTLSAALQPFDSQKSACGFLASAIDQQSICKGVATSARDGIFIGQRL